MEKNEKKQPIQTINTTKLNQKLYKEKTHELLYQNQNTFPNTPQERWNNIKKLCNLKME